MKFVCLGYIEEGKWEAKSPEQRDGTMKECFAYDDELRKNGNFIGGEALEGPRAARTLRYENGTIIVMDGPYAETTEQLGGILLLEAKDMDHAVQLMTKHPGIRLGGPFEIRPAFEEINEIYATLKS